VGEREVLECGGVRLDGYSHRAFVGRQEVGLTLAQFRLLVCLLRQPGRVFTRAELAATVMRDAAGYARTIDQHVKELRRKLGRRGLIETVWGVGYRLGAVATAPSGVTPTAPGGPAS
jgi:two-component system phosphate regulon response regulator PhoB